MRDALRLGLSLISVMAAPADRPTTHTPVPVYLMPIDDDALGGCKPDKLEAALLKKLRRKKHPILSASPETAAITLRVTECISHSEPRVVVEERGGPVTMPTEGGKGRASGGEQEYGIKTEAETRVLLTVHATWADHFADLVAGDKDRTLDEAADTVVSRLEELVRSQRISPSLP
jgi:hypothetical protein